MLHSRPYRNTSQLVDIFSSNYGRLCLVAKGVRKSRSGLAGILQPFQPLTLSWVIKGDLGTLISADCAASPRWLGKQFVLSGMYVNELLVKLTQRHDPHCTLYKRYDEMIQAFHQLSGDDKSIAMPDFVFRIERLLRIFEKHLLIELGYGMTLDHDVIQGNAILENENYRYFLDSGPVKCSNPDREHDLANEKKTGPAVSASMYMDIQGRSLISLAKNELTDVQSLRDAKNLMRMVLAKYLGNRELHSRKLFKPVYTA